MLASHPSLFAGALELNTAIASLQGWRSLPQRRRPGVWEEGGSPSILSTRNGGFIALLETDWRQAWVPCWLNPGADEHLMEGGG